MLPKPHTLSPAVGGLLRTTLLITLGCLLTNFFTPGYFYHDDNQVGADPIYRDMARAVWQEHSLPFLSPYSWTSSAILGETQLGVLNPPVLFSVLAIYGLPLNPETQIMLMAITFLSLTGCGMYLLARSHGLDDTLSLFCGVSLALSPFVFKWFATSWMTNLQAFAFVPWTLYFLNKAGRNAKHRGLMLVAAGLTTGACLATGSILIMLGMGVCLAWHLLCGLFSRRRLPCLFESVIAGVIGSLMAAPALLCLMEYASAGSRTSIRGWSHEFLFPWRGFAALFTPLLENGSPYFSSLSRLSLSYAGMALPCLLLVGTLMAGRTTFRNHWKWMLGAVMFSVLLVSPTPLPFRWSIRFVPFLHLFVLLWGAGIVQDALKKRGVFSSPQALRLLLWASAILALLIGTATLLAGFGSLPEGAVWNLTLLLWIIPALWFALQWHQNIHIRLHAGLLLSVIALFFSNLLLPEGVMNLQWRLGHEPGKKSLLESNRTYLIVYDSHLPLKHFNHMSLNDRLLLPIGSTSLNHPVEVVNGYSNLYPRGTEVVFGSAYCGVIGSEHIIRWATDADFTAFLKPFGIRGLVLLADNPATPYLEYSLSRSQDWFAFGKMDRVHVWHSRLPRLTLEHSPGAYIWKQRSIPADPILHGQIILSMTPPNPFDKDDLLDLPGGFRAFGPVTVTDSKRLRNHSQALVENRDQTKSGLVWFRQPWFPGHRIYLDSRPLPVYLVQGVMPATILPPGSNGRLQLVYRPYALLPGLLLAGLGLALSGFLIRGDVHKKSPASAGPAKRNG
ncbi:MAG: hypothetical protein SFY92_05175 [Verrucomicrobiae bacterium]|nr:hypothetical protein [Verrucomicrobiae bacterium]